MDLLQLQKEIEKVNQELQKAKQSHQVAIENVIASENNLKLIQYDAEQVSLEIYYAKNYLDNADLSDILEKQMHAQNLETEEFNIATAFTESIDSELNTSYESNIVQIEIISPITELVNSEYIEVKYMIESKDWKDGDTISLLAVDEENGVPLYKIFNADSCYECFEYATCPVHQSNLGVVQLKLPDYGGYFKIVYSRKNHLLGSSISFHVKVRFIVSHTMTGRRGAGSIQNKLEMKLLLENLSNIRIINIYIHALNRFSRVKGWIILDALTKTWKIIIESDLLHFSNDGNTIERIETVYGMMIIKESSIDSRSINVNELKIERFTCSNWQSRIPYTLCDNSNDTPTKSQQSDMKNCLENGIIKCRFCSFELANLNSMIQSVKELPTGVLDNVMHEFICCQDMKGREHISMTLNDIITPTGTLLINPAFVSLNAHDFMKDKESKIMSEFIALKSCQTMIDIYSVEGHTAAAAPFDISNSNKYGWPDLVLMNSCLLNCPRCRTYIGDAILSSCMNETNESLESIEINDISDVRLSWNNIDIYSFENIRQLRLMTEQLIARIFEYLYTIYHSISFCLHITDYYKSSKSNLSDDVIIIRVLNKNYQVSGHSSIFSLNHKCDNESLQFALKVSYRIGKWNKVCKGNELRIPMQLHEFNEMKDILQYRRTFFPKDENFLKYFKDYELAFIFC